MTNFIRGIVLVAALGAASRAEAQALIPISDLLATRTGAPGEVLLTWTAPMDVTSGGAAYRYNLRYRAMRDGELSDQNWGDANTVDLGDPISPGGYTLWPGLPGSTESAGVAGISPTENYCFAIKWSPFDYSAVATWSPVSVNAYSVYDLTPPAAIDLSLAQVVSGVVTLKWVAPGSNGTTGRAYSYDLRMSTGPISEASFAQADRVVAGVPAPGDAGELQEAVVTLPPGGVAQFAIKAQDANGNWSGMSNVVSIGSPSGDDGGPAGGGCGGRAAGGLPGLVALLATFLVARQRRAAALLVLLVGAMAWLVLPGRPEAVRGIAAGADTAARIDPPAAAEVVAPAVVPMAASTRPRRTFSAGTWGFEADGLSLSTEEGTLVVKTPGAGEFSLRLKSAGSLYSGEATRFSASGHAELSATRGAMVERLRPVDEGVEQLFDLDRPPADGGDLDFRFEVGGTLRTPEDGTRGERLSFWNGRSAALSYGKVVVIDAKGASLPRPVEYRKGEISFSVPGEWLASAAYPVVVDPLIQGRITVAYDNLGVSNSNWYHNNDLAYAPATDRYLSVYCKPAMSSGTFDLYANFLDGATGQVGFTLALDGSDYWTDQPALAWNPASRRFLVVYCTDEGKVGLAGREIRGQVLDEVGARVGGPGSFRISTDASVRNLKPRVACDGSDWLVIWSAGGSNKAPSAPALVGRIIRGGSTNPAPVFGGPGGARITIHSGSSFLPAAPTLAFGGGDDYLVVWHEQVMDSDGYPQDDILGRRVTKDGLVAAGPAFQYDQGTGLEGPAVAANPTNHEFLVGWMAGDSITALRIPVVRRAGSDGTPLASPITIGGFSAVDCSSLAVAWNEETNQYLAAWMEDDDGISYDGDGYVLMGARLHGPDPSLMDSGLLLGVPSYPATFADYDTPTTSAVSRAGSTHVLLQWKGIDGPYRMFGNVEAQRYDMTSPPAALSGLQQSHSVLPAFAPAAAGSSFSALPRRMSFRCAAASDPDPGDTLRLQVEITDASGRAQTFTGPAFPSGSVLEVTTDPIPNGSYTWCARAVDNHGVASDWSDFPSSAGPAFTLDVPNTMPGAPSVGPGALTGQFLSDGTVVPFPAGVIDRGTIHFKADLPADPDDDFVRLEIEVQRAGIPFTGSATVVSSFGLAGLHEVQLPVLPNTSYHWQAWTRDNSGASNDGSSPVAFGSHPDIAAEIDFARGASLPPAAPIVESGSEPLGQYESDGLTALVLGGTAPDSTVIFRGRVSDPDGDPSSIQIEIKPVGEPFDGGISGTGTVAADGEISVATLRSIRSGRYHWRARAIDIYGSVSADFSGFGSNGDVPPAGIDFVIPNPPPGGSEGGASCVGGAGTLGSVYGGVILVFLAGLLSGTRRASP